MYVQEDTSIKLMYNWHFKYIFININNQWRTKGISNMLHVIYCVVIYLKKRVLKNIYVISI